MDEASTRAIAAIYDAVIDQAQFDIALDQVCRATGSDGFNIFLLNNRTGEVPVNMARGIPDEVLRDYNQHFVMVDPGIQFFLKNPNLPFYYNALHTSEDDIDKSEYYSWLQKMGGARYYLAQTLKISSDVSMIATAQRGRHVGHAQQRDIRQLGLIGPHIQRAMQVKLMLDDANRKLALSYEALDRLEIGVVILNTNSIVFANKSASQLTKEHDRVWLGRSRLEAAHRSDRTRLDEAIAYARQKNRSHGSFSSLTIEREHQHPLILHILALSERHRDLLLGTPSVLILIKDPERSGRTDPRILIDLFDLTPSEAAIAVALGNGASPEAVCLQRGISANTLKTHRKRIFSKIGVSSQSELATLLSKI